MARDEVDSEHLDAVEEAHERMGELIEELLTGAREDEIATECRAVGVRDVVDACRQTVEMHDATVVLASDGTFRADEGRVRQLFENRLRNAIEHGRTDPTIRVGTVASSSPPSVASSSPPSVASFAAAVPSWSAVGSDPASDRSDTSSPTGPSVTHSNSRSTSTSVDPSARLAASTSTPTSTGDGAARVILSPNAFAATSARAYPEIMARTTRDEPAEEGVEFVHEYDGSITAIDLETGIARGGETKAQALRMLSDVLALHAGGGVPVEDPDEFMRDVLGLERDELDKYEMLPGFLR